MKENIFKFLEEKLINIDKNNNKPFLMIDFDDTLVETQLRVIDFVNNNPEYRNILENNNLYPLKYHDIHSFDFFAKIFDEKARKEIYSFPELYHHKILKPKPYAIEFINLIKEIFGKNSFLIVTSSFEDTKKYKDNYIEKVFNIPNDCIIHSSNKKEYYKNSIAIDDGLHNFSFLNSNNIEDKKDKTIPIQFVTPWNISDDNNFYRIKSLEELYLIFVEFYELNKDKLNNKKIKNNHKYQQQIKQ